MTTLCVSPWSPDAVPPPLVLALSLACASTVPLLPNSAHAQAATRSYDLPAQPLAAALDAYSRLTGVDLVIGAALPQVIRRLRCAVTSTMRRP